MWKLLSHFLDKNFVKATVLLKNILRSSRSVTFTEKIWISFHWSNNEIFVKSLVQKKTWELIWRKINLFQLVKIDSYITHWFRLTKKHNIRCARLDLIWRKILFVERFGNDFDLTIFFHLITVLFDYFVLCWNMYYAFTNLALLSLQHTKFSYQEIMLLIFFLFA